MSLPICRYCGANALPREHHCAMRVVFVPSTRRTQDIFTYENVTLYARKTLEQCQQENPDAVVMGWEEAYKLEREQFLRPVREVTREKFWDALEVLPPCKWTRYDTEESFFVSERIFGDVVSWFARVGERYFTLEDSETLTHREVVGRCALFIEHPGTLQ